MSDYMAPMVQSITGLSNYTETPGGLRMALKLYAAPAVEPVTLAEAKSHIRVGAQAFEQSIDVIQSIPPGSQDIGQVKGAGVEVASAGEVVAVLQAGAFGSGGSVAATLQESDTDIDGDYKDYGPFDPITANSAIKLKYPETRRYVRGVATVAGAPCEFGLAIVTESSVDSEDAAIMRMIKAARRDCELYQGKVYITQTWDMFLDHFPWRRWIEMPFAPLQTVVFIKYKDLGGAIATLDPTEYEVDAAGIEGRVGLAWGRSWPIAYDGMGVVQIRFTAGYGLPDDVPEEVKQAILMMVADLYSHRGDEAVSPNVRQRAESLLGKTRLVSI